MKILNYNNRFKAVLDIIFKPAVFNSRINSKVSQAEDKLSEEFESKTFSLLQFKEHEERRTLVSPLLNYKTIPLLQLPIIDPKKSPYPEQMSANIIERRIERINLSFASSDATLERLKEAAAQSLSKELIKGNFLQTRREGGLVEFYINFI